MVLKSWFVRRVVELPFCSPHFYNCPNCLTSKYNCEFLLSYQLCQLYAPTCLYSRVIIKSMSTLHTDGRMPHSQKIRDRDIVFFRTKVLAGGGSRLQPWFILQRSDEAVEGVWPKFECKLAKSPPIKNPLTSQPLDRGKVKILTGVSYVPLESSPGNLRAIWNNQDNVHRLQMR